MVNWEHPSYQFVAFFRQHYTVEWLPYSHYILYMPRRQCQNRLYWRILTAFQQYHLMRLVNNMEMLQEHLKNKTGKLFSFLRFILDRLKDVRFSIPGTDYAWLVWSNEIWTKLLVEWHWLFFWIQGYNRKVFCVVFWLVLQLMDGVHHGIHQARTSSSLVAQH